MTNREVLIRDLLKQLGVPTNIRGYKYIIDGVMAHLGGTFPKTMGKFYCEMGAKYGTSQAGIESGLHHASEYILDNHDSDAKKLVKAVFGGVKLTNVRLLTGLAEYISIKEAKEA